ncbi:MAG: caspase family protein, partial [Bacteroidales bacterium]|nr:caspase family protein [Bacteroidales bacterium]
TIILLLGFGVLFSQETETIIGKSPIKKITANKAKEKVLPKIEWISPNKAQTKFTDEKIKVEVCIKSSKTLKRISLFQNNKMVAQQIYEPQAFRSDCDFVLTTDINLIKGDNFLTVTASNEDGENSSELTINYNLLAGKYYALLVAVQDYRDKSINKLEEPMQDAKKLQDILTNSYTFEKENIILLENASKSEIVKTLFDLKSKVTEADNLLIFYAGHGIWDESMQTGYWLPVDAQKDNPVNWFSNLELRSYIKAIPAKHTLLIADACFSGGIFKTRSAFNEAPAAVNELMKLPSRKAMTSGSMKIVPDKSVFMEYLLKRLSDNKEDFLTTEKLFFSFKEAVINNSPLVQVPQYGEIREAGDEGGDFIFIKRK